MNVFASGSIAVQVLGWCLLHFVWQGALVGMAYALVRWLLPRGNPRYLAAMLALLALAIGPAWTVWHELHALTQALDLGDVSVTGAAGTLRAAVITPDGRLALLQPALPWLVLAWGCGVAFLGVRVVGQWRGLRAIVRAAEALPAWQARAALLERRLGLRRAVRILASVRIASPTLVGWVRPVVVLPLAMLAQMPAHQVDLILAHELAHLKRFDHLANLFQVVLETLFFYHPVVHWIARDARNERELCCDALALHASGGQRRDFVEALAGLAEFRAGHADVALAASGGVLVERAWFIAGMPPRRPRAHPHLAATLLALLGVAIALGVAWRYHARQIEQAPAPRVSPVAVQMPAPAMIFAPAKAVLSPLRLTPIIADAGGVSAAPVQARRIVPEVSNVRLVVPTTHDLTIASAPVLLLHPRLPAIASAVSGPAATVAPPRPLRMVAPVYPQQALVNGVRGRVVVAFTLDAQGRPRDLDVVSASPSGVFDAAALRAIAQWRFRPQLSSGRRYQQAFSFAPDGARGADVMPAENGCHHTTGTHICRRYLESLPASTTMRRVDH